MNKNAIYWKLGYLFAGFGVYLVDQVSKAWVKKTLELYEEMPVISGFLNFYRTHNPGVAFSQLNDHGEVGRWGLSGLAAIAACAVMYFFWRTPKTEDRILSSCALLLAGILGNLTDRARLGYVIDFIDVQFGTWHYPTFNVADSAICLGALLLIYDLFFSKNSSKNVPQTKIKEDVS